MNFCPLKIQKQNISGIYGTTQVNSDNHARVRIPMPNLEQQSNSEKACKKVYNRIGCHLLPAPNNINEI